MTNREFFVAVTNCSACDEEVKAFAQSALEKMDAANEKRRNTPSKTAIANAPLLEQIVGEVLTSEPQTASDVASAMEISTQKASALLRQLVAGGQAVVTEVKLPKKGTCKAYALAD